jgi:hypothetical protein
VLSSFASRTIRVGRDERLELGSPHRPRNTATHILNGRLMSITIDDDIPNRRADGLIGMQVRGTADEGGVSTSA